jgi:CRP-like cAMP-binding protein
MTTTIVYAACGCTSRLTARARVRRALADLAVNVGPELDLTQAEIARAAGTTRETASRELARLERAGVVTQSRGHITVHAIGGLVNEAA